MTRLRLDDFLPYQLSVTSNAVSSVIARTYESLFGLKIPEWRLIAVLAEEEGLTQQALVQRTEMDKMTVSRAAQGLAERGMAVAGLARNGDRLAAAMDDVAGQIETVLAGGHGARGGGTSPARP